ncbi:MAG: arginine decarboxylase, pyruvoyl-dependent [Candidatus Lokiarchaeota archaeon]|nr:arginine decarboxylase, pyruvoyl-dependent [Candidatus Lokiarchaeota archaeon]MBD3199141.1 arginine decarboxylase, pyruvoyl-dependent [Candidatus Lokiarchaeota archaeon]
MSIVPKKVFFVTGKGYHKSKLSAFEEALRDAGIERFNLVSVSSILPPYCIEIEKENGLKQLRSGQIVFTVLARASSNEFNRLICASIGVAKPADKGQYGYLSEHHTYGVKPEKAGDTAEDLAAEMLATTLGISFSPEADYDEKKEIFKMEGRIVETKNFTSSATVRDEDEWATVVAAAVFIL